MASKETPEQTAREAVQKVADDLRDRDEQERNERLKARGNPFAPEPQKSEKPE